MKKTLLLVVLLSGISSTAIIYGNQKPSKCLSDPDQNRGHCEKMVDGSGLVCVQSVSWKPFDCIGQTSNY